MAKQLTEPLRRRHEPLKKHVAEIARAAGDVPSLDLDERREAVAEILDFLRGELWLHAEAEEAWLYPEIALQLRHPASMAGMAFDHKLLRERIEELEATDVEDVSSLQAVLYGLHELLTAHFRKEEEVYLPLLEYEQEAATVSAIRDSMARHERGDVATRAPEIDLEELDFPAGGLPVEKLAYLIRYAVLAPSSHNSQPWRFRLADDSVELLADRSRALPVVDPDDRELVMSCGAALFTLRVAIRHHGLDDEIELLPDEGDPDLLARIRLGKPRPPTRAEKLLFWAISSRHTNRSAFKKRPVPETLLTELAQAAESEGAHLRVLERDEERNQLADLIAEGDKRQFADASFRRELAAWIHAGRGHTNDGMPAHALDIPGRFTPFAPLLVRTFDVGKGTAAHDRKIAERSPALAVLGTPDDTPRDWLVGGQALARVLLRATQDDVSASFLNQPIEVADLRAAVSRLAGVGVPQLALRLGYGPTVKATPRRPLSDVVLLDDG
jgi:iron-sulfur cluster repair protein YtfE (RIC family)/nitroreductase